MPTQPSQAVPSRWAPSVGPQRLQHSLGGVLRWSLCQCRRHRGAVSREGRQRQRHVARATGFGGGRVRGPRGGGRPAMAALRGPRQGTFVGIPSGWVTGESGVPSLAEIRHRHLEVATGWGFPRGGGSTS